MVSCILIVLLLALLPLVITSGASILSVPATRSQGHRAHDVKVPKRRRLFCFIDEAPRGLASVYHDTSRSFLKIVILLTSMDRQRVLYVFDERKLHCVVLVGAAVGCSSFLLMPRFHLPSLPPLSPILHFCSNVVLLLLLLP